MIGIPLVSRRSRVGMTKEMWLSHEAKEKPGNKKRAAPKSSPSAVAKRFLLADAADLGPNHFAGDDDLHAAIFLAPG